MLKIKKLSFDRDSFAYFNYVLANVEYNHNVLRELFCMNTFNIIMMNRRIVGYFAGFGTGNFMFGIWEGFQNQGIGTKVLRRLFSKHNKRFSFHSTYSSRQFWINRGCSEESHLYHTFYPDTHNETA